MATKLENLLSKIDPSRTYDDVLARIDRAFNSFPIPQGTITSYEDYENVMALYYRHIEKNTLRLGPGAPDDKKFYWGRCIKLIEKAYSPNGYHTAYTLSRTGKEGGLYQVLKKIADLMAEEYTQNQINTEIYMYWDSLSVDEKLAASDEYLGKYGHLLPNEMTEGNAPRIKAFFVKVLEEHPKLIRRMGRIGR